MKMNENNHQEKMEISMKKKKKKWKSMKWRKWKPKAGSIEIMKWKKMK